MRRCLIDGTVEWLLATAQRIVADKVLATNDEVIPVYDKRTIGSAMDDRSIQRASMSGVFEDLFLDIDTG